MVNAVFTLVFRRGEPVQNIGKVQIENSWGYDIGTCDARQPVSHRLHRITRIRNEPPPTGARHRGGKSQNAQDVHIQRSQPCRPVASLADRFMREVHIHAAGVTAKP